MGGFFDGEGSIGIYRAHNDGFHLKTQLSQCHTASSDLLVRDIVSSYGGSYSIHKNKANHDFFNWQLNGFTALAFLERVSPYLRLKKEQAFVAMAWQQQRPVPSRTASGHFKRYERNDYDARAANILKMLKSQDASVVLAAQSDAIEIMAAFSPVLRPEGGQHAAINT